MKVHEDSSGGFAKHCAGDREAAMSPSEECKPAGKRLSYDGEKYPIRSACALLWCLG